MAIKKYKPTSDGRRGMTANDRAAVTAEKPHRALVKFNHRKQGRNNHGRITSRFRGGGHKRLYRTIDWKRDKYGVPAKIATIEYDPNRTSFISLVHYADGEKRYILTPAGLSVGDPIVSDKAADITSGNSLPLRSIPSGTAVHCVEMKIGRGAQMVRTAGGSAQVMARDGDWMLLRMPSGEMRKVHADCRATIGVISNSENSQVKVGKAGRTRWKGRRPHNRGTTMNPVDHPMGGGEGRTAGGGHPRSPWGWATKGMRTRSNKRTQLYIVTRRKKK
ncbi:MAG: 50S ribosomal protein L2 [Nannocystaceae bacterium]|nr:50S ribosomal protein L2 [Nannocystaceae bacterium]